MKQDKAELSPSFFMIHTKCEAWINKFDLIGDWAVLLPGPIGIANVINLLPLLPVRKSAFPRMKINQNFARQSYAKLPQLAL